jgi:hypothetical protein
MVSDVQIHVFLTSVIIRGKWSASRPSRLTPGTYWTGGWVCLRTGLDDVERRKILPLPELELRTLGRPARSLSLYGLLCLY